MRSVEFNSRFGLLPDVTINGGEARDARVYVTLRSNEGESIAASAAARRRRDALLSVE
jgi:hypothetical protein